MLATLRGWVTRFISIKNSDSLQKPLCASYEILLLGDANVGRTSFIALTEDGFPNPEFGTKSISVRGQSVQLHLWDRQRSRFHGDSIRSSHYRLPYVVIIFYDITNLDSFQRLSRWMQNTNRHARENVYKMLIGNKSDLETDRAVQKHTAQEFADELGIPFLEISCENSSNIDDAITMIGSFIADIMDQRQQITYPVWVPGKKDYCLLC